MRRPPARKKRVRRLDEEKRSLAAVTAHFLLMFDVIAADAENPAHREQVLRVDHRERRDIPRRNDVCHSILSWKKRNSSLYCRVTASAAPPRSGYFSSSSSRSRSSRSLKRWILPVAVRGSSAMARIHFGRLKRGSVSSHPRPAAASASAVSPRAATNIASRSDPSLSVT